MSGELLLNRKGLKKVLFEHTEGFILIVVILGVLAVSFLVHYQFSFLNFFFLPVILSGYYLGRKKTALLAVLCVLLVAFYLLLQNRVFGGRVPLSFSEWIHVVTWAGFLILTGGLLGSLTDERNHEVQNMKRAYVGVLSVLLKYLETADESESQSVHTARLAGRMAERAGLSKREVENIKSAALLCDAGELRSNLPLFENVSSFMAVGGKKGDGLTGRDQVLLQTTASLIKEVGPLLEGYYRHYVLEAGKIDKDLQKVPFGSSLIALAVIYDKLKSQGAATLGAMEIGTIRELENLRGRAFTEQAVRALPEIPI